MRILNRYILFQFIRATTFALFATTMLFIIVNLIENLDDFLDRSVSSSVIIQYYLAFTPDILRLLAPIAFLLSSLFVTGQFAVRNEITAMKSAGLSLFQFLLPLLLFSAIFSTCHFYFSGWIVPKANATKNKIEALHLRKGKADAILRNQFLRANPQTNIYFQFYDPESRTGLALVIEKYSAPISPRLQQRIDAQRFSWDTVTNAWKLYKGKILSFSENHLALSVLEFDSTTTTDMVMPYDLQILSTPQNELTLPQYRHYLQLLEHGGRNIRLQLIEYHSIIAFSFSHLIIILFGVPFSFLPIRKRSIALEISIALFAAFFYLAFTKISQSIVASTMLPPVVGAWMTNAVFLIAGLFNILRVRA